MKAIVVYESVWGNTAAIARAIAEGIGADTPALSTAEATGHAIEGVDLIVAGAPLMAFRLPTDKVRSGIANDRKNAAHPPDLTHPSMREWLAALPTGRGRAAAFETRFRWSPGGATGAIAKALGQRGYRSIARGHRFLVTGTYGPLREGEIEKARQWGRELEQTMAAAT